MLAPPLGTGSPTTLPTRSTVVVADDDAVVRALVRALVSVEPALVDVGEAVDGASAVSVVEELHPDLLVLDHDLGDLEADVVVARLRWTAPATRVLLHSGRADVHAIARRLGVAGSVRKQDGPGALLDALDQVRARAR